METDSINTASHADSSMFLVLRPLIIFEMAACSKAAAPFVESSDTGMYFKRGRVPSYEYLVVSLLLGTLLEIVESLLKKDTFNLSSPVADVCKKAAHRLHDWLKVEENKAVAEEFYSALHIQFEVVADCLNNSKKISAGREKMWTAFHKLRTSADFRSKWEGLFKHCHEEAVHPHLFQQIADIIFKKVLASKVSVLQQQDEEQVVELTRAEENALRYAAGYVCKQVSKKLKSSTDPSKQELFLCMEMLRRDSAVDSECETSEDSSLWMDIIDRGGLWHIKDDVFPVFYAMEEEVRRFIRNPSRKQSALDVKQLSNAILSCEDVLFFWSIATVQLDENEERLLLKKITKLWITVRGFAYTSAWIEQYKQKKSQVLQKKKALRKTLQ